MMFSRKGIFFKKSVQDLPNVKSLELTRRKEKKKIEEESNRMINNFTPLKKRERLSGTNHILYQVPILAPPSPQHLVPVFLLEKKVPSFSTNQTTLKFESRRLLKASQVRTNMINGDKMAATSYLQSPPTIIPEQRCRKEERKKLDR